MLRNLEAIEIAEGALLADVAVIFQVIAAFLPIGSSLFELLIFIVFAVLVLRRGLYVGIMGMLVALFVMSIVIGPQHIALMFIECIGGIFLGVTMKRRWHHLSLLLLGIVAGAFVLYCLLWLFVVLIGYSIQDSVQSLHHVYTVAMLVLAQIATKLGIGNWWQQDLSPRITALTLFLFTYWWATLYFALCAILTPFVSAVYLVTNACVRLLGYEVRPFPDARLNKSLHRGTRRLLRLVVRRGIIRKLWSKA